MEKARRRIFSSKTFVNLNEDEDEDENEDENQNEDTLFLIHLTISKYGNSNSKH